MGDQRDNAAPWSREFEAQRFLESWPSGLEQQIFLLICRWHRLQSKLPLEASWSVVLGHAKLARRRHRVPPQEKQWLEQNWKYARCREDNQRLSKPVLICLGQVNRVLAHRGLKSPPQDQRNRVLGQQHSSLGHLRKPPATGSLQHF